MIQEVKEQAILWAKDFLPQNVTDYNELVSAVTSDPDWYVKNRCHFEFGMWFRNKMRDAGFGEKQMKVDNLDDHYVEVVEKAVK